MIVARVDWMRLFRESFVPVAIVILALFLTLLYVQFRAELDADAVTVIDIRSNPPATSDLDTEVAQDAAAPAPSGAAHPDERRADALMAEGKWGEAETLYLSIVANEPSSRALGNLGALYLKKGDVPRALDYLNRAVGVEPVDNGALFNRALALSRGGRRAEAMEAYRALLVRQPSHFEGQYNLAILMVNRGDHAGGAAALEQAARLAGGERKARALNSLGIARRELGQFAAAASAFDAAIRLRPTAPEPRVARATLEPDTAEGQARALAQYRQVLELVPNYSPALVNMAAIFGAQHKRRDAEQALRRAIQFDPEYTRAHIALGLLLLAEKNWAGARSEFEWVLQQHPARADAHFNLGRVAYAEKAYERAIEAYRAALKTAAGNYPEALLNLGLTHSATNNYAAAIASYEAALKQKPDYPEAWYNIGIAFLRQKNNERAEEAFKRAVKLRPDYEQAWFNLGIVYSAANRDEAAMDAYRKAASIRPHYRQAQLNLAVRHAKRKEYAQAIALYRAIVAHDDTYALAWLNLGNAYIANKQAEDAVAALRRALALDPSNTKTLRILGRALLLNGQGDDAVRILQNAVAADPANARLRLELARALRKTEHGAEARAELAKAKQLDSRLSGVDAEIEDADEP